MKQLLVLVIILIVTTAFAQTHAVYIEVWDCDGNHIPVGDIYYEAVIIERLGEIVTMETFGWEFNGVIPGYISGNLGNGFSSWAPEETLEITLTQISTGYEVTNSWIIGTGSFEHYPNPGGLELLLGGDCVISADSEGIVATNLLNENYPNPFNPTTTINFSVKENETGILTIYNAKGQVVENGTFFSGAHNYIWNADNFSSAIYFYKLKTDSFSEVKKMMLIK